MLAMLQRRHTGALMKVMREEISLAGSDQTVINFRKVLFGDHAVRLRRREAQGWRQRNDGMLWDVSNDELAILRPNNAPSSDRPKDRGKLTDPHS